MIVKLLPEHHLEFLLLKGGCRGLSDSTLVKMPHCWESHVEGSNILFGSVFRALVLYQYDKVSFSSQGWNWSAIIWFIFVAAFKSCHEISMCSYTVRFQV